MASDDKPVVHLGAGLWNATPGQFIKYIKDYINEFKNFDPDNFMIVNHFLLKGDRVYAHKENLCEVVDVQGLCGKCKFMKTEDCARGVTGRNEQIPMAVRILELTESLTFFRDRKIPYVWMKLGEERGWEAVALKDDDFEHWVSLLLYNEQNRPPSAEAIKSAISVLTAKALFDGKRYNLHNRVAEYDGNHYYDLCNGGKLVRINNEGWEILDKAPIPLFKKYEHQKPSFMPLRQEPRTPKELREGIEEFLEFINHDKKDMRIRILLIVSIVALFLENFAHPQLFVQGEHGTAKTSFGEYIKWLVDNSDMLSQGLPKGSDNIVQCLEQHWFGFFDNMSEIYDWQSDIFCRTITRTAQQTRKLYSDDGVFIRVFRRCIGLNGIEKIVNRPDLVDRTLLIVLPRISELERLQATLLEDSFREAGPRILGTVFDIISSSIRIHKTIKMKGLYRLADWTVWGCAISRAIGIDENDFLKAYRYNRSLLRDEVIESNDIAATIYALMQDRIAPWEGIMSQLYDELTKKAEELKISTNQKDWPKKPNSLSRSLPRVTTDLREIGIVIEETGRRDSGNRKIWQIINENVFSLVKSETESDESLERYLNDEDDDTNDTSDNIVSSKQPESGIESPNNDINDTNDISAYDVGDIPKSDDKDGIRNPENTVSPLVKQYEKRWQSFLKRTADFSPQHKFTLLDIDKLYPIEKERAQVQRDLKDWTQEGRLWKLHSKGVEGWRVSERGSVNKDGGIKL